MAAKIDILVSYDVSTVDKPGRRRLRKVALVCENYGQRVQYSVFECRVSQAQLEALTAALEEIIEPRQDSLLIYRLPGGRGACLSSLGRDGYVDFEGPMVV